MLAARTSVQWLEVFDAADIPAMPVYDPDELPENVHLAAEDFWEIRDDPELGRLRFPRPSALFSATPGAFRRLPPRLGEHSVEILAQAGYGEGDIDAMLAAGATHQHAAGGAVSPLVTRKGSAGRGD